MNKKIILGIIITVIIILLGVIYVIQTSNQLYIKPIEQRMESTSDWKTYTNSKYGFQIDYPSDWIVQNISVANTRNLYRSDGEFAVSCLSEQEDKTISACRPVFAVMVPGGNERGLALYILKGSVTGLNPNLWTDTKNNRTYELVETSVYNLTDAEKSLRDMIIKKMESSFKFTEPTTKADTSNWKTYKNDEYGLEFEYPQNWLAPTDHLLSTRVLIDFNNGFSIEKGIFYNQDLGRVMTVDELLGSKQYEKIIIDGKEARKIVDSNSSKAPNSTVVYITSDTKGNIITVINQDNQIDPNTFNRILSTLKFTK